ncbi:hypothetical protein F9C07_2238404 [Aspergillus flavus]|uniref:Uncharacterized protein n=2 Tax=Aspergillus flavus TaxID=5059 RepID=A0A7U2MEL3_ASPFN|nr:hypothetical protein NYO67_553 [Aspergillus flavus]QRD82208.1 hypothetical protein F9C07_2238404 [Aspergillus flavus]RAQ60247.1 hypothetical protein COH21_000534 [Aspergillus flavus]RAQ66444.1 hypothetical protein COH20_002712 [Aspergillus flavus]RMZ46237.1 hypothetical protein CA14_011799 [Aspergillus flavus]
MVSEPFKATQPSPGEAINPQVSATEALWWVALQARSNWKWARPAASPDNLLDKGGGDSTWKFTQDELHAVPDKLNLTIRYGTHFDLDFYAYDARDTGDWNAVGQYASRSTLELLHKFFLTQLVGLPTDGMQNIQPQVI